MTNFITVMYNQLFSSLLFSPFTCRFIQENISLVKMLFNLLILQFPPVVLLYSVERKRKIYRWRPMWFQQTNLFKICLPRSLILFLFLIWFVDLDYMQTLASFASFCCYRFFFFFPVLSSGFKMVSLMLYCLELRSSVDELINFGFFSMLFLCLVADELWRMYTRVKRIRFFLVLFLRLVDDKKSE
jgi:hypothetical protein